MKKAVAIALSIAVLLFLAACGAAQQPQSTPEPTPDYAALRQESAAVETYIMEHVPAEGLMLLYSYDAGSPEDDIIVLNTTGGISVSVRAVWSFCIPALAKVFCPVILDAIESVGGQLRYIDIQYYAKNSSGIVSDSMVGYNTKDGITGSFVCTKDTWAEGTVITSCTADDLFQHYQKYDDYISMTKAIIRESGGDPGAIFD